MTNNVWAGVHYANCISCSLRKTAVGDVNLRHRFSHNTFFEGAVASGGESVFVNNLVMPPSGGGARSQRGISGKPIQSDYNLLRTQRADYEFRWDTETGGRPESSRDKTSGRSPSKPKTIPASTAIP